MQEEEKPQKYEYVKELPSKSLESNKGNLNEPTNYNKRRSTCFHKQGTETRREIMVFNGEEDGEKKIHLIL